MLRSLRYSLCSIVAVLSGLACEDTELLKVTPVIEVSPNPIVLPPAAIGLSSRASVVIRNQGSAPLELIQLRLSGSPELSVRGATISGALVPGESRSLELQFAPTGTGDHSGALTVSSNDPARPELSVPISASVQAGPVLVACLASAELGLSERCTDHELSLDLGAVPLGATLTATLTLRSVGTAPVHVATLGLVPGADPSFSLSATAGAFDLAPGASATALLRYQPSGSGAAAALVLARSNDALQPEKRLHLTATAVPQALCVSPPSLDFGSVGIGQGTTLMVQASACGNRAINLTGLDIVEGASEFEVTTPITTPVPLANVAGLGFSASVRFTPRAVGNFSGKLRVQSDAGDAIVPLLGSSGACDLTLSPSDLRFPPAGATRTFSILNVGVRPCTISSVALSPGASAFSLDNPPSTPRVLAPGASENVEVSYAGGQGSAAAVEVGYSADGSAGTKQVSLHVDAEPEPGSCQLEAVPGALGFGLLERGVTAAKTITFVNNGTGPCVLAGIAVVPSSSTFQFELQGSLRVEAGGLIAGVVRFSSAAVVSETAVLRADLQDPGAADLDVPLSASTHGPLLCVRPARVDFGSSSGATTNVSLTACGSDPVVITSLRFDPAAAELSLDAPPALPFTLAAGATQDLTLRYQPVDTVGDVTTLLIGSNDAAQPERRVLITGGANVPEICDNGLDEDNDGFIDEDCVPGRPIGRAVVLGQGRLFVWGDEHVKMESYGARPAPFWRGVFGWLSCEGCPGPRRTRIGDLNAELNPLMRAEASALGLSVTSVGGTDAASLATVDAVLAVANFTPASPDLLRWVQEGGALMIMAIGIGSDECTSSLDAFTAGFPLFFDCTDPNPWGPVGVFKPHPISFGLQSSAAPFVNGHFVAEAPGTHSTVIALP